MPKYKYQTEYEVHAHAKMIFPYLSTASGLQEWFADEVNIMGDKSFMIDWEGEKHRLKMVAKRTNNNVKYVFLPEADSEENEEEPLQYLEFRVDYNEMTQSTFIRITDYSDMDDEEELKELWDQLIGSLKELIGAY